MKTVHGIASRIIRLDEEILKEVAIQAKEENRSSNAFIITAIQEKLQRIKGIKSMGKKNKNEIVELYQLIKTAAEQKKKQTSEIED